ncbi:hypothetical protein GBW32_04875 [Streptomyces tsukubensis]|uniref:Uncharacterized protein n=1 Tax=Streptomyces tsukubensis TaxID=83656 RepID=A0A1V3ZZN7_9ACTN|nr:hypothetical protein B1H18_33980 [Streptomyces tsukubensis]QFR92509.1 hypothetical protein GBW32_04875 [Streptomyces tsukubensis]
MTQVDSPTGRRRRASAAEPHTAESVPQWQTPPPTLADPPIYRELMAHWAEHGRTLPGRRDPEWSRLAAPPVRSGQFSGIRDPRDDGR